MRSTRASALPLASTPSRPITGARKSRGCSQVRRLPPKRARRRSGCCVPPRCRGTAAGDRATHSVILGLTRVPINPRSWMDHRGKRDDEAKLAATPATQRRGCGRLFSSRSSSYSLAMGKISKTSTAPEVDKLTKAKAKVELMRLALEIEGHDKRYYQEDAPKISDAAYDALRRRVEAIEARFPDLVSSESPTQKVGAAPSGRFAKVRHAAPMLSLGNAFSDQDVADFVDRVRRFLRLDADEIPAIVAEPKIDGLSLSLRYEHGELVRAATRGDGLEGEDVTANARTINDIPNTLKGRNAPAACEIRGEVYMLKQDFLALNKKQAEANDAVFANPRNSAAGSLRQKAVSITASGPRKFFACGG